MIPARTRATRIPKSKPEKTIAMADALRLSGARSATSGMRICGVTDTAPTMKDRASKASTLWVTAKPIENTSEKIMVRRMSDLRRTKSPRGVMNKSPPAYLWNGFGVLWLEVWSLHLPCLDKRRDTIGSSQHILWFFASKVAKTHFDTLACVTPKLSAIWTIVARGVRFTDCWKIWISYPEEADNNTNWRRLIKGKSVTSLMISNRRKTKHILKVLNTPKAIFNVKPKWKGLSRRCCRCSGIGKMPKSRVRSLVSEERWPSDSSCDFGESLAIVVEGDFGETSSESSLDSWASFSRSGSCCLVRTLSSERELLFVMRGDVDEGLRERPWEPCGLFEGVRHHGSE